LAYQRREYPDTGKLPHEIPSIRLTENSSLQVKNIMSAAHAFATKEGSNIYFPHIQKAVKVNEKVFREFYGVDYVNSTYS
jgi:hypothetical protein